MKIVILSFCLLLTLGLLGKVAWTNYQLTSQTEVLNSELMQANLSLGRAETSFGQARDKVDELDGKLQKEIRARSALVTRYGVLQARYDVLVAEREADRVRTRHAEPVICKTGKFVEGLLYQATGKKLLSPVTEHIATLTDFRIDVDCTIKPVPNKKKSIPTKIGYQLHQRFGGQLVETRLPSGGINHYVQLYELDDKDRRLSNLKLKSWTVVVADELAPQWYWWAPHLDLLGFVGGGPENLPYLGASVGVSFMGYGATENDLSWRVLRISGDFGTDVGIGITPALYNLGELIPLISNLWIGPHISKGLNTSWTLGLVLGAQL